MGKSKRAIAGIGVLLIVGALAVASPRAWLPQARAAVPAQAPNFQGITHWINSKPLTMQGLRGKVVLIDFWAYSCINCLRTLPYVTHWYDEYKDKGLVVVGVHSPEFKFGQHLANIQRAVKHFHIHYPVAMDSHMDTWRAWNNQFWPAEYLVNRQGEVVLHHYGEGHYLEMDNAIRKLLGLPPKQHEEAVPGPDFAAMGSPEMYFGTARRQYMANTATGPARQHYALPTTLGLNQFALGGLWQSTPEYVQLIGSHGKIRLHFKSAKLYMVASSDQPVTLHITVDGKPQPPVTVHASKLYTLFDGNHYDQHTVTIDIPHPGLRAFTFTFG